ncbi:MAG: DUF2336 domain-containing protein [Sphingobacteriia bacterium]|nr:DUF2336 domain-containing protein [Sphingobacteriia bacterium]
MPLLQNDLEQLKSNPTTDVKKQITEKITFYLDCGAFSEEEKVIALEIVEMIVKDADKEIRKIVSRNLKTYPELRKQTAFLLATDIEDEVATPIIEFSTVLEDYELIQIIESTQKLNRLMAITKRSGLTEGVAEKIIDKNIEEVTTSLLNNKTARISEKSISRLLKEQNESNEIMKALIERGGLSPVIIERVVSVVSEDLKKRLIKEYKLPTEIANDVTNASQEEVVANKLSVLANRDKTLELVDHLHKNNKLTQSLILRALCKGDVVFFALGLGRLAQIPDQFAENMVINEGPTSFAALYKKADMPKGSFEAVNILLKIITGIVETHPNITQKDFAQQLIQKIIDGEYDKKINMMNHFLIMISSQIT